MNTPDEGTKAAGQVMVLGKVGKGRAVHFKMMIAERRAWPDARTLDALLEAARSGPQSPTRTPLIDPLRLSPAQMIIGTGDRERRQRMSMQRLHATADGLSWLEPQLSDSRKHNVLLATGVQQSPLEWTTAPVFAVDSSRLSCSTTEQEA
jgi:hypothetical protein